MKNNWGMRRRSCIRSRLMILVLCLDLCHSSPIQHCQCRDGYEPEHNKNGSVCAGVNLFHIMPCNMPTPPKCQCSGRASSILKDRTGTWCTRYSIGEEWTRWPCENTKEWDEFFGKYPDFI